MLHICGKCEIRNNFWKTEFSHCQYQKQKLDHRVGSGSSTPWLGGTTDFHPKICTNIPICGPEDSLGRSPHPGNQGVRDHSADCKVLLSHRMQRTVWGACMFHGIPHLGVVKVVRPLVFCVICNFINHFKLFLMENTGVVDAQGPRAVNSTATYIIIGTHFVRCFWWNEP